MNTNNEDLPAVFHPSLLLYAGLLGPGVLLLHTPTGTHSSHLGNRGGSWHMLPPASALTPLLPFLGENRRFNNKCGCVCVHTCECVCITSMSVTEPLISTDHSAPTALIAGGSQTPKRDLSTHECNLVHLSNVCTCRFVVL